MKIIVCVKQVPDTSGKVAVKEDGTMDRAAMDTISNPDDMNALEAALQIKDTNPDVKVIVVSMGPPPTESMLRECLAMGADEAVLVSAREFGGADTYATSSTLTAAIRKIGVEEGDIVFCGRQAIDGDTAQVGPQIAEKLNIPQVTYVTAIDYKDGEVTVRRELEDGYMTIKVKPPCLLTCIKEHPPLYECERYHGVLLQALHRLGLQRAVRRPHHHRGAGGPEGLSHPGVQVLLPSGEGRRHHAGGGRQGHLRAAGVHPEREAHYLRKGVLKHGF